MHLMDMWPDMIFINRAKCLECGDVIDSFFVHDFRVCSCGNVSVDGGMRFLRRKFMNFEWEDLSMVEIDGRIVELNASKHDANEVLSGESGVDLNWSLEDLGRNLSSRLFGKIRWR